LTFLFLACKFKNDYYMNNMNTAIDIFGNTIEVGNLAGTEKTVSKNRVLIYGEVVFIDEDANVTIKTRGYKGNPDIKDKIKETYIIKERNVIKMQVKKK